MKYTKDNEFRKTVDQDMTTDWKLEAGRYVVLEYLYSIPNTITYLNNIRHKSDSDSVFAQYDVLVHLETFDIAHKTPIAYQNQRIFKNSAAQMRIGLDASTEIITWGIGKYINSLKVSSKLSTVDDTVELFRYIDDTTSSINKGTRSTISDETLKWLNKGDADNVVYYGVKDGEAVYTGITKQDLAKRLYQHNYGPKGKGLDYLEEKVSGLTRNQARAIEQYLIENGPANAMNQINSISPNSPYYKEALIWAKNFLNGLK